VLTAARIEPQGTDFAFQLEFSKEPWGDTCKNRCANVTLFLDTDNNKKTGLKLSDEKAAETGADLAVTVLGLREYKDNIGRSVIRVKVVQFNSQSSSVESGLILAELAGHTDTERVAAQANSIFLLVDTNAGSAPLGRQMRVVYHPPSSEPVVGFTAGMAAKRSGRFELFKGGKLSNPVRPRR
jgi:hypothetical protein